MYNTDLSWIRAGQRASGCNPQTPGAAGTLNVPLNELLQNTDYLKTETDFFRQVFETLVTNSGQTFTLVEASQIMSALQQYCAASGYWKEHASSVADAYVIERPVDNDYALPALVQTGYTVTTQLAVTNATTEPTLAINGVTVGIQISTADGTDLQINDLPIDRDLTFRYDGVINRWLLLSISAPQATSTQVATGTDKYSTISPFELAQSPASWKLGAEVVIGSPTAVPLEITNLPATTRFIRLCVYGLSNNNTTNGHMAIQLGSSSYITTGYKGQTKVLGASEVNWSTGAVFYRIANSANEEGHGVVELTRLGSTNIWLFSSNLADQQLPSVHVSAGSVDVGAVLQRLKVYITGSTLYDAGTLALWYQ